MCAAQALTRRPKRPVHGIVLLDKPLGLSSNQALQRVKYLLRAEKAGHTGSLDPQASGLLPLCFGDATKVTGFLLGADKTYEVEASFGEARNTGDSEGEVSATGAVPAMELNDWADLGKRFLGSQSQVPPMYSALKVDGQRLYKLARQGLEVERQAREITISELECLSYDQHRLRFRVRCSKGTYVRTLVEDLARAAGTVGYTSMLRRVALGPFQQAPMFTLEQLLALDEEGVDSVLIGADAALVALPALNLSQSHAHRIGLGQRIHLPEAATNGLNRLYGPNLEFLGIGEVSKDQLLAPKKLFQNVKNY